MRDTLKILGDLENTLEVYCKPVAGRLQKGLTINYIDSAFNQIGINDDHLRRVYTWKNGIKFEKDRYVGEFDLCSQGKMLPLEEAIDHYNAYTHDSLWEKKYFPLFTTNAGDYLLYDMDKRSKTYGMLFFYSPSLLIIEPEAIYDSIESFIKTVITCYKEGVYKFNEDRNTIEIDQDSEFNVSSKINFKSTYWKE